MLKAEKRPLGPSSWMLLAAFASAAAVDCVPKTETSGAGAVPPTVASPQQQAMNIPQPPAPPAPPEAPEPPVKQTGNVYTDRFLSLWTDMHNLKKGYFSPEGIPYHAVETMAVEAPDYGHMTTSEAYSYWVWLEAMYGKVTKDWSHLDRAWKNMEYYMIPTHMDQPTNYAYPPTKPATYADEYETPDKYPAPAVGSVKIGNDPIGAELKTTYNNPDMYTMHWLLDVDNWYGFGQRGDGKSHGSYFNTFQRGPQESVWETIPQPCWEDFNWGGKNGYLDLFGTQGSYQRQWKYSAAPDADARVVQAAYWAKKWAAEQGGSPIVNEVADKAAKLGDYVRYAMFDKYFKTIGCRAKDCPAGTSYESAHYLISWYYSWGGANPGGPAWAWRIASSHAHNGYQNPMTAYALSQDLRPKSPNGARDWGISLQRMLEFYRWLQAPEGAIAGGATNSWNGRYEVPPAGTKTFYGMAYDVSPVYLDPPSNEWFGFQAWTMERVAEYYYVTGDPKAKMILDRWVKFVKDNTDPAKDGCKVISIMKWTGAPQLDWDAKTQNFDANDKDYNNTLHVQVMSKHDDPGVISALAHVLTIYAAKTGDTASQKLAKELLDRMWTKFRTPMGVAGPEVHKDWNRFGDKVYVPPGWTGKMPNGETIDQNTTFISLRSKYKKDKDWPKVEAYLKGGPPPEVTIHRFWAQAEVAIANAVYGWLFPNDGQAKK
jgi:hypothetical protein